MNEHAQAWVATLRSGEYKQTTRYLRTDAGYCCLGVACDLYAKEHPNEARWLPPLHGTGGISTFAIGHTRDYLTLPDVVRDWLGLRDRDGAIRTHSLAELNDTGASFEQIARRIEQEPKGLFA